MDGSVSKRSAETGSACNSFCEAEDCRAGEEGVGGCDGLAQQAGVAQCEESQPVLQQLDWVPRGYSLIPAETMKTLCQARMNPSRSTVAIFTGCSVMTRS